MSIMEMGESVTEAYDFYERGSGSTIVLLHGLSGTWHIWKPVLKILEASHHVLAVTLPGHHGGAPLASDVEPSVSLIADRLIADFGARGIRSAHVVGNSLGGWLALELARRGFARSVVAFSPAGAWRTSNDYRKVSRPFRIVFALMPVLLFVLGWLLGIAWLRRSLARQTMEHADRIPADEFRDSLVALKKTEALPGLLKTMGRDGPIAMLDTPETPISIVWGECDQVIPFERYGLPMLERVPRAACFHMGGVGHVPMYDNPGRVAQMILEVVSATDAGKLAGEVAA